MNTATGFRKPAKHWRMTMTEKLVLIFLFAAIIVFGYVGIYQNGLEERACQDMGGVIVKHKCISKDAIINLR